MKAAWVDGVCKSCGAYTHSCKCEHEPIPAAFKGIFAASTDDKFNCQAEGKPCQRWCGSDFCDIENPHPTEPQGETPLTAEQIKLAKALDLDVLLAAAAFKLGLKESDIRALDPPAPSPAEGLAGLSIREWLIQWVMKHDVALSIEARNALEAALRSHQAPSRDVGKG